MKSQDFLANVRNSLARSPDVPFAPDPATHLALGEEQARRRAQAVQADIAARADELMAALERSAAQANWNVARVSSPAEAAIYIRQVAQRIEARAVLRSAHASLDTLDLDTAMFGTGISLETMALDPGSHDGDSDPQSQAAAAARARLREQAIHADIGITGVDYAIAETGSCVLLPRKGVSRVISLLPPVHIAVVQPGQILPSLDELFALRRDAFLDGDIGSYLNIISGPSRSADIEYKLITGVHGPGEVHMILLG